MRINAIVAEYNPFHNGHRYHLETSLSCTDADYTIIAMSGNFMQRGTPAIINKYDRAEMALRCGADLVLEIPAIWSCSSAEYYAHGAVSMLDKLGVADFLCFGSECGDVADLRPMAEILASEPEKFRNILTDKLKQGLSYPAARSQALTEYDPSLREADRICTSPNNILGLEYIKALLRRNSRIRPVTIKRTGAGYHDGQLTGRFPSATGIRSAIIENNEPDNLQSHIPSEVFDLLNHAWKTKKPIQADDFSQILLYRLLSHETDDYDVYLDVSPDLSDKIKNNLFRFRSFEDFCDLLKSKDNTHTRLSRSLMHILLDIRSDDVKRYRSLDYVPYARVLGLRKDAAPLLSAIKEHSSIPLITKLADADKLLSANALQMLRQDIRISHIYNAVESSVSGTALRNEYRTPIIVL